MTERVRFKVRLRAKPRYEDVRLVAYLIALSPWLVVMYRLLER